MFRHGQEFIVTLAHILISPKETIHLSICEKVQLNGHTNTRRNEYKNDRILIDYIVFGWRVISFILIVNSSCLRSLFLIFIESWAFILWECARRRRRKKPFRTHNFAFYSFDGLYIDSNLIQVQNFPFITRRKLMKIKLRLWWVNWLHICFVFAMFWLISVCGQKSKSTCMDLCLLLEYLLIVLITFTLINDIVVPLLGLWRHQNPLDYSYCYRQHYIYRYGHRKWNEHIKKWRERAKDVTDKVQYLLVDCHFR